MPDKRRAFTPPTDDQLDALAEVTPADVEQARRWAAQRDERFAALLEAEPDTDGDGRRDGLPVR